MVHINLQTLNTDVKTVYWCISCVSPSYALSLCVSPSSFVPLLSLPLLPLRESEDSIGYVVFVLPILRCSRFM
jgi:hypothetical protein